MSDEVRALGLIIEGQRGDLLRLYATIESSPGITIRAWQDGERRSLEVRTRRPRP